MKVTIAGARVSAGMTQQDLADKIGVSRCLVNRWEKGKAPIKTAYIYAISKVTGFPETDIILPEETTESGL